MARRIEYNFIENAGGFEPISKSSFVVGKQYDADSKSMACHTPEQSTNATTSPFTIIFLGDKEAYWYYSRRTRYLRNQDQMVVSHDLQARSKYGSGLII